MALTEVLDQAEIDALLGNDKEEVKSVENSDPSAPKSFDFREQERMMHGRMPTLEIINDRYLRNLKVSFFNFLRRYAEIAVVGIKIIKFGDYTDTLYLPTSLNIVRMKPLRGNSLFILDAKLVYILVDNYFGGAGKFHNKIEGRDFTPTENRLIQMLLAILFEDLKDAWSIAAPVEFIYHSSEVNPSMANIFSENEILVVCKFRIDLEGGGGEMHFAIPYSTLDPIRHILESSLHTERSEVDETWVKALHEEIFEAPIDISSIVLRHTLKLKDLVDLEEGDIIPMEMPDHSIVTADGVPIFKAKLGVSDGRYALKIIEEIEHKRNIVEKHL